MVQKYNNTPKVMTAKPMTAQRMTQPRCVERESSLDLH
jgi:hypothetical protein